MDEVIQLRTISCSYCGRNFSEEALMRHERICAKTSQKTKKYVYDSSKVRSVEPEVPSYAKKTNYSSNSSSKHLTKPTSKREQPLPGKKNNWRQQHEDLVRSLRAARQVSQAIQSGKPLPPPLPPSLNPDYISCDYCGRRFNESAAQRHIDFCREQHERLPKGRGNALAAQKQATRINYKPPTLKSRKPGLSGYSDNSVGKIKASTEGINSKTSYATHDDPLHSAGRSSKNNPANPVVHQRSSLATRPGNSKQQGLSQSSNYLDSPSTNGHSSMDARMVGRGRASISRPAPRFNDSSPTAPVGRMPTSSSHNSSLSEAKFCSECGCKYPTSTSKFCSECGSPRVCGGI